MGTIISLDNVRVLAHSAIRIESADGTVLYFDPFELRDAPHDADIVLITHSHGDHLSIDDAEKVMGADTALVCPASMVGEVAPIGAAEIHAMTPGGETEVDGVRIEAVAAYNVAPERLGFHPKEHGWVGYVVTVDGVRYYVAGDTDENPDNVQVACDVALVPVGGTFTMDAAEAAAFVKKIRPSVAVPTHYGTAVGAAEDGPEFKRLAEDEIPVVLKMEGPASVSSGRG